jgi:hypothetical protein
MPDTATWNAYMNFHLAKILPEGFLLLWGNILVSEEDNASLCDEKTELILLLICEVLQLKTNNLRANMSGEMDDFFCRRKKRFLFGVGTGAWIYMEAIFVSDIIDIVEVKRPRRSIRITLAQVDARPFQASSRRFREAESVFLWQCNVYDARVDSNRSHDNFPVKVKFCALPYHWRFDEREG